MTNGEILTEIDTTLDRVDALIQSLDIKDKKALAQKVYDLFAQIEQKVEESC